MQDFDKTTSFVRKIKQKGSSLVTIFDGDCESRTIRLNEFGKDVIYFGRSPDNDIVLNSEAVSRKHGRFVHKKDAWIIEDKGVYDERESMNGLIYNNARISSRTISDGDFIRIDKLEETVPKGVLFVFSSVDSENKWLSLPLSGRQELSIGREKNCDIMLPHVSVSRRHAKIIREKESYYIIDNNSTNGVIVNNRRISGKEKLHEKDVIVITNSKFIFTKTMIFYCCYKNGISVDANDIFVERKRGIWKKFITSDHVSLNIKPGELVAIIGGSGTGKSTILNCMCGYLKPKRGEVYINGINLYHNFAALKKLIGYVPQSDIVYDNLTLHDMLLYTAKLRLPPDTTSGEREAAIERAIHMVELSEKRNRRIKHLSGGEKKRASIAIELLSDPNLLFLDEPASGLDPGTERNLMGSLRKMADSGKTVILVTHSTLQLKMCDRIVFIGNGGKLCFYGSYDEALTFFGVSDVVDVYDKITEQAKWWSEKFEASRTAPGKVRQTAVVSGRSREKRLKQLGVLSARYLKLIAASDIKRLLLLFGQAPALVLMISFVADGNQFEQYEMTKSLLFALSCSAFWLGMLNAIQEICKERTIMKREYMTGLSLSAYVASKIIVLGILCLIQSALITGMFGAMIGLPEEGIWRYPFLELFITTFITAVSSAAMGLCVSSLCDNADRAMTYAPILLMPQILFSGLIFKLNGATEILSLFAVCRWSMEGYGTTVNLNALPLKLQQEGIKIPHEAESFFEFTSSHLLKVWGILILFTIAPLVLARIALFRTGKEKS